MNIIDRFFKVVKKYPNRICVEDTEKKFTYLDLSNISNKIANNINSFSGENRILILLKQGFHAYGAMFGSLLSGGYYSACNIDAPIEKKKKILKIFSPTIIISTKKEYKKLISSKKSTISFIDIEKLSNNFFNQSFRKHRYAYVCFTSGSTGDPKGVIISQKSLSNYIDWAIKNMKLSINDRWSQHPNISFDLSVLDIYGALCSGGTLYPFNSAMDRMMPAQAIKKFNLTIWNSVPSVIGMMIKAGQLKSKFLKSLRLASFCGEPLLKYHVKYFLKACPKIIIHNTYGPTESTVSMTLIKINKDVDLDKICDESVSIGKSITNTNLYLFGGQNKNEGEIVITGKQLADGYWKLPKENKKSFKKIKVNGKFLRAYFTGDWAKKKNGYLFFKKRLDRQSKIKGYRIELDAIDNQISKLTKCQSLSVVVKNKLYCFIEKNKNKNKINLEKINLKLRKKIDDYCIPNKYIFIDVFPRNQNDKIDLNKIVQEYL